MAGPCYDEFEVGETFTTVGPTITETGIVQFLDPGRNGVARFHWPERVAAFEEFARTPSLEVHKPALIELPVRRVEASTA